MSDKKYFIINGNSYLGNSPMLWRKEGAGYTQWLDDAERFTAEEADRIIKSCIQSHNFSKVPVDTMYEISKLTVDVQDLSRYQENMS